MELSALFVGERCKWIWFCIFTVCFSIHINGSPNLLSPHLFIIIMEASSWLLDRAVERQYLAGFTVSNCNNNLWTDLIFKMYATVFQGSFLFKNKFGKIWVSACWWCTKCGSSSFYSWVQCCPTTYEIPKLTLGLRFKSKEIWAPILDKMAQHVAGWKKFYLSKGGKHTLIKWTLCDLPVKSLVTQLVSYSVFNRDIYGSNPLVSLDFRLVLVWV